MTSQTKYPRGGEKINVGIFDRHLFFYGKSILDIYPSNW